MYPHNLKSHLSLSVFIALIAAMLLTDVVIFVFWYKQQVRSQTMSTISHLTRLVESQGKELYVGDQSDLNHAIESAKQSIGQDCSVILIRSGAPYSYGRNTPYSQEISAVVQQAIIERKTVVKDISYTGLPYIFRPSTLVIALPFEYVLGQGAGIGVVLNTGNIVANIWEKQKIVGVYILLNAIIFTTLIFFRMRKVILKPVETLVAKAENYQVSNGGGFISEYSVNEFGQLSRAMSSMVGRIEKDRDKLRESVAQLAEANRQLQQAQEEVIGAEKLAAIGRISAGLAHEIGNPVSIIQGYLELMQNEDIEWAERKEFTKRGLDELKRIDTLLQQLFGMTRGGGGVQEPVNLKDVIETVVDLMQLPLRKSGVETRLICDADRSVVKADRGQIQQVIMNMVLNSIDAIEDAGRGKGAIGFILKDSDQPGMVVLKVSDSGKGIRNEDLSYVFEPFFTTKEEGKGTGLGLAVAYRIVREFGGGIEVESKPDSGTTFTISLPIIEHNFQVGQTAS